MKHLDLFTGILGFAYAAKQVWRDEYQLIACCEKDKFCQNLIRKRAPGVPIFDDIRNLGRKDINGTIDIITGGFPCQPFSVAGQQKGKEDDRYLWDEMLRIIAEIRPTWVVGENVAGIIKLALDDVLTSLENEGYTTETYLIPAAGVGAPHKRERVWIVAYNTRQNDGRYFGKPEKRQTPKLGNGFEPRVIANTCCKQTDRENKGRFHPTIARSDTNASNTESTKRQFTSDTREWRYGFANNNPFNANTNSKRCEKCNITEKPEKPGFGARLFNPEWKRNWLEVATTLCRMDDGVSGRMDRLRALGNAIVPQVAMQIFEAIRLHELNRAI